MGDREDVQSENEFRNFRLPVRWWVVFQDLEHSSFKTWWHMFTKDMFRHCWAFADFEHGTITINSGRGGIQIDYGPVSAAQLAKDLSKEGKVVLPCDGAITNNTLPRFAPLTCVGVVKHLLGIKSVAVTPYQLYRYLVKNNLNMLEYNVVLEALDGRIQTQSS